MVQVFFYATVVLSLLLWLPGFWLFSRMRFLGGEAPPSEGRADLSVIIPARDEERRIRPLLESLVRQTLKPREVIVVDDHSRDRTREVAESYGLSVVGSRRKPSGWNGKSWACWQGAKKARGRLLLFLDADVCLKNDALTLLMSRHRSLRAAISVQPYHRIRCLYENLSAFVNLAVIAGLDAFSRFSRPGKPAGAFGPCLLVSRDAYFQCGGHRAVGRRIVDDMALGRLLTENGSLFCFLGKGTVEFRMYPRGIKDLVEGWSKNLAEASSRSGRRSVRLLALWISGIFSSLSLASYLAFGLSPGQIALGGAIMLLYIGQIHFFFRRAGNFSFLAAVFYPVSTLVFLGLFALSLFRTRVSRSVRWKGRRMCS
ncbi:MAG: glycosyltransferase [Candidatus Aminicenantes bacterium]|nr:glycosyltransferase [Candidatus Aminicenantes bacterium]